MFQQTPQKRVLFPRTLAPSMVGGFLACLVLFTALVSIWGTPRAAAATNSTINFQARLENTSGSIAPDGNYNVQFKLYSASSGGTALWTETYQNSNSQGISVKNGYLTTSLGSITAFPGTINWDQDLWVTLNIGGTTTGASPTYDGEMNPRLHLTSVPYAFRAGQLAQFNSGNGFTSTLSILQPTSGNQTFQIPDMGAAGTYNVCIANSSACGFALSSGNTNYIQNQISSAQTGSSFWIDGTGRAATALQAPLIDAATASTALNIGTTNANQINLNQNVVVANNKTFTANGTILLKAATASQTAFQISNTSSTPLINVDSTNNNLVSNSSFEPNITNWSAKGTATLSQTSSQVFQGFSSLQAIVTAANSGVQTSTFTSALAANTQYELTFMASCSASIATFTYGHQDVSGTDINATTTANCDTNWRRYTFHFTTGATVTSPNIYMTLGSATSGTLWIDAVNLAQTTTTGALPYYAGSVKIDGVITDPVVIKNVFNSTNAFEVQDVTGHSNTLVADTVNNLVNVGGSLQTGGTTRLDASGNLTNIGNISAAGNVQQSGTGATNYFMGALGLGTTNPQSSSALTLANSKWISSVDAAGTGFVNMFQVNSSNQIQVGAALNVDGGIVLPADGGRLTVIDEPFSSGITAGTANSYTLGIGQANALTVYGENDGSGNAQNVRVAIGNSINPQYPLDVTGDVNSSTGFRVGGTAGLGVTCSSGQILQNQVVVGGIVTGGTCVSISGSGAVTAIGTIDSQTKSANGAVITGGTLYMQSADASNPGLVTTGAQTFAGAKTFNSSITISGANTKINFSTSGASIQGDDGGGNSSMTFRAGNVGGNGTIYSFRNKADTSTVFSIGDNGIVNAQNSIQTNGTTRLDNNGNLSNIGNIGGSGTIQMSGTSGSSYIMSSLGLGTTNPQAGGALTVANGKWISSVDSAGTGYVNMFQVNSNNQIQVGAALNIDGGIILPTNGGQLTLSDLPIDSTAIAGTKESYTLRVGSANALTVYGEADGSGNAQNIRVAIGSSIAPAYTLDVGGDINTSTSYRINGTAGASTSCSGGQVLQNQVVSGGIVTGGSCTTITAGGTAGGDLSGTYPNPTVAKINGVSLGSTTATAGNLLIGSGTQWVTQALSGDATLTSGGVLTIANSAITSAKIQDATVTGTDIANNTITNTNLQSGSFGNITGVGTLTGLKSSGNVYIDTNAFGGTPVIDLAIGDTDTGFDSGGDGQLNAYSNNVNVMQFRTTGINSTVSLQTGGTTRLDTSGNLSNIGTIGASGNITTTATVQGGTVNATTALQTGGTQRIDASGNLSNIGTIGATGKITTTGDITTGNQNTISFTRTVPTTVGTEVDLGSFAFSNGGANLNIDVVIPSSGYSSAKHYSIPVYFNGTGNTWQFVQPISDTGPYAGNDVTLEININSATASLRLRRSAGTTAGTAYLTIQQQGVVGDAFTASTATAAVSAPTAYYGPTIATQSAGTFTVQGGLTIANSGGLTIGGQQVITSARVLQNVTTDASIITSGTIASARISGSYTGITGVGTLTVGTWNATAIGAQYGGTGINGATAANGSLLIGNGAGYTLATLGAGSGIAVTNGSGTISVAVDSTVCRTTNNCSATGTAGGDLTGSYPNPTIAKLQGGTLTITTAAAGNILQYTGTAWVNQSVSGDITINSSGVAAISTGVIVDTDLSTGTFTHVTGTGALAAGSIASGFGTISTTNNITTTATMQGGTVNATTALQTNGTQRIDASGNLSNIGTISASGYATINNGATVSQTFASSSHVGSIVPDGGFEYGGQHMGLGATYTVVNNSVNAHTGNQYLQATGNSSGQDNWSDVYFQVNPGEQYYAESWVKADAGTTGTQYPAFFEFTDKDKANNSWTAVGATTNPGTTWVKKSGTVTVPAGKYYMRFGTSVRNDSTTGNWYWDDLYISRVDTPAPLTVAGNITASNGVLVMGNTSNSNTITLQSGATSTSYALTLPTAVGNTNDCLRLTNGTGTLGFGTCSLGTLQNAYDNSGTANPQILLSSTNGGVKIADAATPISGNLFSVQNNAGTATYLGLTSTALTLQDSSGRNGLVFDSSTHHLKIYENVASPTRYVDIYYDNTNSQAVIAASSGTTQVGSGSGNIDLVTTGTNQINLTSASMINFLTSNATGGVLLKTNTNSTVGFQIQNSSTTALFTVDTSGTQIILGASSTNGMVIASTGEPTLNGSAQHAQTVVLNAEYPGSVLDAQSDATCTSANDGTMTSGYDGTNRQNWYNWTSTNAANQCYDVVVQVPIPSDFAGWNTNPIVLNAMADTPANTAMAVQVLNSSGTVDTNYNYAAGTITTGWTDVTTANFAGTYTAGSNMTIRIRMTAKSSANLKLGTLTLNYKSKY